MKKITTFVMALLLTFSTFSGLVGCGPDQKVDESKTALYVNVTETGAGTAFGDELEKAFEAKYANQSFEEGKTGVDVVISHMDISTDNLEASCSSDALDVIYAKTFIINDHVNVVTGTSNYLEDITDVFKSVDENGDTIESRMTDSSKAYHNVGTDTESKYYSIPWYNSYYGTVYDVDLFKEKGFYYTATNSVFDSNHKYEGLDGIIGTADDAYGPDGKTGIIDGTDYTLDDGLPATWDDFFKLMDVMVNNNVIPFVFTNTYGYIEDWLQALWIDYEGSENWNAAKTFNGTYTYLNEKGEEQYLTYTEENGYEVSNQYGKKLAVKIAEKIVQNGWYETGSFNATTTHNKAQEIFIKSNIPKMRVASTDSKKSGKPIAMLMEGTWWENEARNIFNQTVKATGDESYAYGNREFGYMPFPKWIHGDSDVPATTQKDSTTVRCGAITTSSSVVVVNKNSKHKDLAKEFIKFAYSNEMQSMFAAETGMSPAISSVISDADYAKMTPYQRNLAKYMSKSNVTAASGTSRSTILVQNKDLVSNIFLFRARFGEEEKSAILSIMREKDGNGFKVGFEEYWAAIQNMDYQTKWAKRRTA